MTPLIGFVLVAAIQGGPSTTRIDMTGLWIPDLTSRESEKELKEPGSNGAPAPPPPPVTQDIPRLRIADRGRSVVIESIDTRNRALSTLTLTADRKENVNPRGKGLPVHVSTSERDVRAWKMVWRLVKDGANVMTGETKWVLSDDGATLMETIRTEDSKSKSHTTTTYRRGGTRR